MVKIDEPSSCEIRTRIATAKSIMSSMNRVWSSSKISRKLKKRLVKSLVWSVALYGCESWTLKLEDERRVESFELWCWRRMLNVKWTDMKTNEWVRERVGVDRDNGLLRTIMRRKLAKFGHWQRRPDSIPLLCIEMDIAGPCKRGRPKMSWINNVDSWPLGGINTAINYARKRQRPPLVAMD